MSVRPGRCPYDHAFLAAQERRLREARAVLLQVLRSGDDEGRDVTPSPTVAEPPPSGPVSLGAAELEVTVDQAAFQLLRDVDAALARVSRGRYGWDVRRGVWIRAERLRAVPWAEDEVDGLGSTGEGSGGDA